MLGDRGCTNVLVEGGSEVLGSFFDEQEIDEAHVFIAPKIVGGSDAASPIAGQEVRDIDFPEGVLLGGVMKDGNLEKPKGSTRINEGDIIALFALSKDIGEVERLLQVSIDYF